MTNPPGQPDHLPEAASLLDALRLAIYRGELTPGQRLVEADLASRFETSRGAVREALALLTSEGLVSRERNRGAQVRPVSLDEALEITEVRSVLEGLCARKATQNITAQQRRELKKLGKEMSDAARKNDIVVYNRSSQEIHTRVRDIAQQDTVAQILERLRYKSVRFQFHVALLPGRPLQGMKEHSAIIDAVCSGDPDRAEQVMREHLMSVKDALHKLGDLRPMPALPSSGWN